GWGMERAPAGSPLGRFGEHDDRPQPLSTANDRLDPLGAQPFRERRAASSHLEIRAERTDGVVPGVQSDAHGRERATGGGVDTEKTSPAIEEQQSARREPRSSADGVRQGTGADSGHRVVQLIPILIITFLAGVLLSAPWWGANSLRVEVAFFWAPILGASLAALGLVGFVRSLNPRSARRLFLGFLASWFVVLGAVLTVGFAVAAIESRELIWYFASLFSFGVFC